MWDDDYLMWDADEYSGIQEVLLISDKVWHPRVVIINSITDAFDTDWLIKYPLAVS